MHKCITYINVNMQMFIGKSHCLISVVMTLDFRLQVLIFAAISGTSNLGSFVDRETGVWDHTEVSS